MGDFDISFQRQLERESWSLYSVGILLIFLRIFARWQRLGFKTFQIDDYIMIAAACLYTMLIVCLNVISQGGGSNLYRPEDFATFTPGEIKDRIKGSKIVVVSEQAMLNVIYCIKACMLIMYSRLTLGLKEQIAVKALAVYVACGWVGTELAFFFACRPFRGYWALPPPNSQCTTLQYYAITQGCFNISSDALMLLIPLPLIIRMAVPWRQKIILVVIFGMGIFVILAAILTKVFNLSDIWDPGYMLWYTREASVAVYVSNLPMIWPLLRQWFPFLRSLTPGAKVTYGDSSNTRPHHGNAVKFSSNAKPSFVKRVSSGLTTTMTKNANIRTHISRSSLDSGEELDFIHSKGSQERITKPDEERESWSRDRGGEDESMHKGGITKSTTIQVHEERRDLSGPKSPRPVAESPFGDDVERGTTEQTQKWDWEHDGGNNYAAGIAGPPGLEREREGRVSSDRHVDGPGSGPRRIRSISKGAATREQDTTTSQGTYRRRDTEEDEQLSRF